MRSGQSVTICAATEEMTAGTVKCRIEKGGGGKKWKWCLMLSSCPPTLHQAGTAGKGKATHQACKQKEGKGERGCTAESCREANPRRDQEGRHTWRKVCPSPVLALSTQYPGWSPSWWSALTGWAAHPGCRSLQLSKSSKVTTTTSHHPTQPSAHPIHLVRMRRKKWKKKSRRKRRKENNPRLPPTAANLVESKQSKFLGYRLLLSCCCVQRCCCCVVTSWSDRKVWYWYSLALLQPSLRRLVSPAIIYA